MAESESLTYGRYLHLDDLLGAQHPLSRPEAHDELLFIVQHQTSELWLKLALHELTGACDDLARDDLPLALKRLARVKHVQKQLIEQWSVLATLTPTEYQQFRGFLGSSSGFQSYQYRAVEFLLGAKDPAMIEVLGTDEAARALLTATLERPSLYDEFLRLLARRGHPVPADVLERDVRTAHREDARLVEVFRAIYDDPEHHWDVYEACEELVDVEDNLQLWRFRHLKTVERTIGFRTGTGGTTGASFLRRVLDLTFFPELYAVRTAL
ncbi:tryptophan 2,3-dioxygenase [Actinomycetospora straminea]|uniref:Tryptophan 2,3-dioxygenase n=1 Tax=Actinomycetospora straminea TaxID=663607 RepID=A0ABP9EZ29_9PSEU|nr:tryptophan 2,3-dioxygenase family protein [Actinomycetospora straminea]MDD7931794.1 tryptophan 2,3-dioxygenase family protein [Actinomycetospora straminea]